MRAIVTGAAGGIGRAIALKLTRDAAARGGAHLLLADRQAEPLAAVAEEVRELGGKALVMVGDLADPRFPAELGQAARQLGGLDAVASNAGISLQGPLLDYTVAQWDLSFAVHVRAPWLLAQACHAALKDSGGAFIITASVSAEHATPPGGAYSSSKAAALMLARQLAVEWGPDGIRVNTVSPGMTLTPMTHAAYTQAGVMAQREARIPLRRIGQPEDIANAVAFLAGPDAHYITGADLVVDGGLTRTLMAYNPGWKR
jgi:glucose 1-dehydrogenase